MWCTHSSRTCSRGPTRASSARTSGPRRRSNGREYSSASTASRSSAGVSTTGSGTPNGGWTSCTPSPSTSSKVVRSDSCRATSAASAAASAGTSSSPRSRRASALLYSGSPGLSLLRNHSRRWENDSGSGRPRSATGIASLRPAAPASLLRSFSRSSAGSAAIRSCLDEVMTEVLTVLRSGHRRRGARDHAGSSPRRFRRRWPRSGRSARPAG